MERDVSLIIPRRAWLEERDACFIVSVTESSIGENNDAKNQPEIGSPIRRVVQWLSALAASMSWGPSSNTDAWMPGPYHWSFSFSLLGWAHK